MKLFAVSLATLLATQVSFAGDCPSAEVIKQIGFNEISVEQNGSWI